MLTETMPATATNYEAIDRVFLCDEAAGELNRLSRMSLATAHLSGRVFGYGLRTDMNAMLLRAFGDLPNKARDELKAVARRLREDAELLALVDSMASDFIAVWDGYRETFAAEAYANLTAGE